MKPSLKFFDPSPSYGDFRAGLILSKKSYFVIYNSKIVVKFLSFSSFSVVLESLYCIDGEFKRLSEKIIQIQFEKQCYITFEIDELYPESTPSISVSLELLPRNENETFKQVDTLYYCSKQMLGSWFNQNYVLGC